MKWLPALLFGAIVAIAITLLVLPLVLTVDGLFANNSVVGVAGLDFTDAHEPSGKLIATTLIKGDGAVVKKGQTLTVNYLGQVYDADAPFDESYSKEPAEFPIGTGSVITGWDDRLVGRTVGSRVILEIPPADGYGADGNPDAGIKGTDTLFFVVDILGAS